MESPTSATPPPPIEKDSVRSTSSSRYRPPLPPKERRNSRGSTLQLMPNRQDLLTPPNGVTKKRPPRKHQHPIMNQLALLKHWFIESAKRAKSPGLKSEASTLKASNDKSPAESRRSPTTHENGQGLGGTIPVLPPSLNLPAPRPRITSQHRSSISPAPLTPHSSYRRSSAGLRGRKSTSSSVSSVRSIHHVHTHSKASSTSSTSNSINSSGIGLRSRSPHASIKVLPATPTTSTFPSNIRVVRTVSGPVSTPYNETASFNGPLASPGLVFAKRKKTPFRGPMLSIHTTSSSPSGRGRDSGAGSRSTSVAGRRSGEIIEEENEDEIEEVEAFSPLPSADLEEYIIEGNNLEKKGWGDSSNGQ